MSNITYTCVQEGLHKLCDAPPAASTQLVAAAASQLQTVLMAVPSGEASERQFDDKDYSFFYLSNGRYVVGCACRKVPGSRMSEQTISDVRAFLRDALQLCPPLDQKNPATFTQDKLAAMQKLLRARLEATGDEKINEINAAIQRTRNTVEDNITQALGRGDQISQMQATSNELAQSAGELQKKSDDLNWKMKMQRFKTLILAGGAIAIAIIVLVFIVCKPNLSDCSSPDSSTVTTTTTTTTPSPVAGGIIID